MTISMTTTGYTKSPHRRRWGENFIQLFCIPQSGEMCLYLRSVNPA